MECVYKAGSKVWHPQNMGCNVQHKMFWLGVDGGDTDRDRVVLLAHIVSCVVRLPFQYLAVYLLLVLVNLAVYFVYVCLYWGVNQDTVCKGVTSSVDIAVVRSVKAVDKRQMCSTVRISTQNGGSRS